jgi:tetratricopeptide (TPR) repeat protein
VLAGLAVGVYTAISSSRNTDASAALALALKSWEAPIGEDAATTEADKDGPKFKDAAERSKAARELFEKAATSHGGTGAGALAQLYVGHAALRLADYDGAAKAYQAFLDAVAKDDPLRFAGYSGLAAAQEAKGDRKAAIASLEALVNLGSETDEDAALLSLGRMYVAENEPEKARKSLERIVKDFSESSLRSKAEELIATLPAAASNAPSGAAPSDDESGKP